MLELSNNQIDLISGGTETDVQMVASFAFVGACMGGTFLGPVGAIAGGIVGAVEGTVAAALVNH